MVRLYGAITVAAVIGVAAGCGTDSSVATRPNDAQQLWHLVINQRAVTIAVNQTLQLTTTAQNGSGVALTSLPTPTFQSTNPGVTVNAQGVIHAIAPTTTDTVVASLTAGGVTVVDSIPVVVTAAPYAFKSLSIQPTTGSAKVAIGASKSVVAAASDSSDAPLYGLNIRYWVSNPYIAAVTYYGYLAGVSRGTVWVYASTTSYGVTSTDSV